jgi:aminoglycoside 6'-N-acetyltransferase
VPDPTALLVALRDPHGNVSVRRADLDPHSTVRLAAESLVRRETGLAVLQPWAVDLSGDRRWLAVDAPAPVVDHGDAAEDLAARARTMPRVVVGFRPMTRADFPSVVSWQAQPHVARWWDEEAADVAGAEEHYGPALDGGDPTRLWVVEVNGRSVGMVQDYRIGDHPEYALLTARPDAVGMDYLIGEPGWVGGGVGTRVLWSFLRDVLRPHYPTVTTVFAAPDHRNVASLRMLDKLGFERGLWFDEPQPDGRVDTVVGCTLDVRRVLG